MKDLTEALSMFRASTPAEAQAKLIDVTGRYRELITEAMGCEMVQQDLRCVLNVCELDCEDGRLTSLAMSLFVRGLMVGIEMEKP